MNTILKLLEEEKDKLAKVSETKQGIIAQPKDLPDIDKLLLQRKFVSAGAEYSNITNTFIFPPEVLRQKLPERLEDIKLQNLVAGPDPRLERNDMTLSEILADIRENGIRTPLDVRPSPHVNGIYEILDGHRRFRCAQLLGWGTVPCRVREASDQEAHEVAFTVNNNRANLSRLEQGRWFKIMMEKFPMSYPTQEALAKKVGLAQNTISQRIRDYEDSISLHESAQYYPRRDNGLLDSSCEETEQQPPPSPKPPKELGRNVLAEIRKAPLDIQPQLYREATEKDLTAEQVQVRAKELQLEKLVASVPEQFHAELWEIAKQEKLCGRNPIERVNDFVETIKIADLSPEETIKIIQEATAKQVKKEDARRKVLVNVLMAGYPETKRLLEIAVKRFGRQPNETLARIVFKMADKAVQALPSEQLEAILDDIRRDLTLDD